MSGPPLARTWLLHRPIFGEGLGNPPPPRTTHPIGARGGSRGAERRGPPQSGRQRKPSLTQDWTRHECSRATLSPVARRR